MNIYTLSSLFAFLNCLVLGILIYKRKGERPEGRSFGLIMALIGIWCLFPFTMGIARNEEEALILGRFIYLFACLVPPAFLYFTISLVLSLTKKGWSKDLRYVVIGALFVSLFFLFNLRSPSFIRGITRFAPHFSIIPGPLYLYFFLFFLLACGSTLYYLLRAYLESYGYVRNQLKYISLGFIIAYLGGLMHFLAAYFGVEPFPHDLLIIAFTWILTYAILQHRLLDINLLISKGFAHGSVIILGIGGYFGLVFALDRLFPGFFEFRFLLAHILIFLGILLFIYLLPKVKGTAEVLFLRTRYGYLKRLRELPKNLKFLAAREEVVTKEIITSITNALGASTGGLLVLDEVNGTYVPASFVGLDKEKMSSFLLASGSMLVSTLMNTRKSLLLEGDEGLLPTTTLNKIKEELMETKAELCLPLFVEDILVGILVLGRRYGKNAFYTPQDISLLELLAPEFALIITYKRLESKMLKADKLASLGTLAVGLAHEIRNPLTPIRTFAQLISEGYKDKEALKDFSKVVTSATDRITQIIESIMNLVRPKPLVLQASRIEEIIEDTLVLIEGKIKKKWVKVEKNYDKGLPPIKGDREQLKHVFLNIFLNALDALPQNSDGNMLRVSTRLDSLPVLESGRTSYRDFVSIKIEDNGPGIKDVYLERLFDPFFTTKHGGTGLGLALAHRIVDQHKGFIKVSSKVGEGTTFMINLPVAKEKD
jgi:nitrogen-specific signal transduction histidine kinase